MFLAGILTACAGSAEAEPTPARLPTRPGPTVTATAKATATATATATTSATTVPIPPTAAPSTTEPTLAGVPPATSIPTQQNTPQPQPTAAPRASAVTLRFRAANLAFDRTSARVPAGATVTAVLQNDETGVEHNLAFSLPGLAHGDTCLGPCTRTQVFKAEPAGSYFFLCTLHDMSGVFIIDP